MAAPVVFICGRAWSSSSITIVALLLTVLFNEYVVYLIQSFRWPNMPNVRNMDNKKVLLLVSDPQIQGHQFELPSFIGMAARWDIDRYLSQTFTLAYAHTRPDAVIFLGDLFDEGSVATKEEYKEYYYRFLNIFSPAQNIKKIYIPGDNDVGGEMMDFQTQEKVDRFVKHFEDSAGVIKFEFMDFAKFQGNSYRERKKLADLYQPMMTSPIRIVLNHQSLLPSQYKTGLYKIFNKIQPQLILSGHWHKPIVFMCTDCMKDDDFSWSVTRRDITDMQGFMSVNLKQTEYFIMEIMVPTCSYRMGEEIMGYGVAIIDADGNLEYTVLWSPARYTVLKSYIVIIFALIFFNLYFLCCQRRRVGGGQYR